MTAAPFLEDSKNTVTASTEPGGEGTKDTKDMTAKDNKDSRSPIVKDNESSICYSKKQSYPGRSKMKLSNHIRPCLLCNRIAELMDKFQIKAPISLEYHADIFTWMHDIYKDSYKAPLWLNLNLSSPSLNLTSTSRLSLYNQVHSSMLKNFVNDDNPATLSWACSVGSCNEGNQNDRDATVIRQDYVISYSLYQDSLAQFPTYWLGLKLNIDAVKQWFPGWTIHLYAEKELTERPFFEWMTQYAENAQVPLRVFQCKNGSHPMLERYRPLMDLHSGVCLVRDIDSILSLTDAKIVDAWMRDQESDVLVYSEYKMGGLACGGGVSVKMDKIQRTQEDGKKIALDTVIGPTRGRNHDECRLQVWLNRVTSLERHAIVQLRMKKAGIYCINFYQHDPKIVWSNTYKYCRFDFDDYHPSKEECEKECLRLVTAISPYVHINSHKKAQRRRLLCNLDWCR